MKLDERTQNARRQEVFAQNYPKIIKGLNARLEGKRTIVAVNKITGERTRHTFEDIDKIASGVRILAKLLFDA